ncbi:DUF1440 domain-containing protein [Fructobacillus durionis]|uniref:Uncharacterized membrane protein YagU, involved in acid resistance, DUF1440 family n=1 Tax=Fructobacillus durionis TaxID=283737 RepID=A0A1I1GRU3_9LACO|nr:DUF1440 domain-containing protein [Fructobacillus durionis]SFC14374.1 Uncharacterized membrane protein YagU, involved in acid resistance, DUF1440 family [Fructobacillus durionis]
MFATILLNALWVGLLGGILASLVRIGWQQVFKSEQTTKVEALSLGGGIFVDFGKGIEILISIFLSIFFVVWANYDSSITQGSGTLWGLLVWAVVEQGVKGLLRQRPFFWHLPWQSTIVEIIGYLFWGWAIYLVAIGFPISGVYF